MEGGALNKMAVCNVSPVALLTLLASGSAECWPYKNSGEEF
jgi:hypothetical protein